MRRVQPPAHEWPCACHRVSCHGDEQAGDTLADLHDTTQRLALPSGTAVQRSLRAFGARQAAFRGFGQSASDESRRGRQRKVVACFIRLAESSGGWLRADREA